MYECACVREQAREREKEKERGRRIRMQVGKLSRLVGVGLKIESQQKQNKTLKAKISFSSIRRKISGLHLTGQHGRDLNPGSSFSSLVVIRNII